jgi:hypothetical protein
MRLRNRYNVGFAGIDCQIRGPSRRHCSDVPAAARFDESKSKRSASARNIFPDHLAPSRDIIGDVDFSATMQAKFELCQFSFDCE